MCWSSLRHSSPSGGWSSEARTNKHVNVYHTHQAVKSGSNMNAVSSHERVKVNNRLNSSLVNFDAQVSVGSSPRRPYFHRLKCRGGNVCKSAGRGCRGIQPGTEGQVSRIFSWWGCRWRRYDLDTGASRSPMAAQRARVGPAPILS